MFNYEKPIVLDSDAVAEGVFMASGENGPSQEDTTPQESADYSLNQTNAWEGNKQYDITLTNKSSQPVDSITVTLKATGTVTSVSGNVTGTVNGDTVTITCNNYGNGFAAGASSTFYMQVSGTGDFAIK